MRIPIIYSEKSHARDQRRGSETMDLYRLILKSAADGFNNHRGEEFTLKQLADKYNSDKSKSATKK